MKSSAKLRYLRIAPRKVRLVADMIRGKKVREAELILRFTPKSATEPIAKTLKSAVTSAKTNLELDEGNLYISKITVDQGPTLGRFRARSRGRAYPIEKKTSHVTLELDEVVAGAAKKVVGKKAKHAVANAAEQTKAKTTMHPRRSNASEIKLF